MKLLKFAPNLIPLILSGEKTSTWRLFDDKELKEGDVLDLLNKETLQKFVSVVIVKVREKKLGDVESSDFEGHEKFESAEKMLETYKKYYGDMVSTHTVVKMIDFKLL